MSVWRMISDCPNQPNLPRQLKTHIAFSIFPILDTNLCHQLQRWWWQQHCARNKQIPIWKITIWYNMGHQNDKLDPAFTMRRNLPRNIFNELELCIRIQIGKKILGLRNMQKKLDFFSYNYASDLFWLSRANHWIELDYRSPFFHLQFHQMTEFMPYRFLTLDQAIYKAKWKKW